MIKQKSLLIENEVPRILIPRNVEGRKEGLKRIHWRRALKYIKNGSQGNLDLRGTPLEYLPEGLTSVGGYLDLSYSKIKKLPDKLEKINGNLYLTNTSIEYLPENLIDISGCLVLSYSQIRKLPDKLKINKSFYLYNVPIQYLPDNLISIDGDLELSKSKIKKLPNDLKIQGNLCFNHTTIGYLPENLSIGESLFISYTPLSQKYTIEEIRKMVKYIGGDIYT
jgi:hypothetical protein